MAILWELNPNSQARLYVYPIVSCTSHYIQTGYPHDTSIGYGEFHARSVPISTPQVVSSTGVTSDEVLEDLVTEAGRELAMAQAIKVPNDPQEWS